MRIFFLAGSFKQGGAEFQLLALAKLFKDKGHQVKVVALTDHPFYLKYIEDNAIPYVYFNNNHSRISRVFRTLKEVNEFRPDCLISYLRSVSIVALIVKLFSKRRFKLVTSERTSLTIPVYDFFYFNISHIADVITVNSISKLHYIRNRFPFLRKRVHFIPNILDLSRFEDVKIEGNDRRDDCINIGYVGRISPEKNIHKLLNALSILYNEGFIFHFDMFGECRHSEYLDEITSMIQKQGMLSYVTYHGPTKNVLEVYSKLDLLCLISSYEGFSNVLSEAISAGVPVVASDILENRYLIEDQVNGFVVNPDDVQDIAAGVRKFLLLNKQETIIIRENNRQKAKEIFNVNKVYNQYMSIIGIMTKNEVN